LKKSLDSLSFNLKLFFFVKIATRMNWFNVGVSWLEKKEKYVTRTCIGKRERVRSVGGWVWVSVCSYEREIESVFVRESVCACVFVCEREREIFSVGVWCVCNVCVFVCVMSMRECVWVCEREIESVVVFVKKRDTVCVCVCVCERKKERERVFFCGLKTRKQFVFYIYLLRYHWQRSVFVTFG